jgi:Holliday junction resolvasome RuvABC DNA-binding subunit
MTKVLTSVKGIGKKKSKDILTRHSIVELINILEREPKRLLDISWVKKNILEKVVDEWNNFKKKL